ncbi:hypothetical protein F0562_029520 [Nyssa sinensis]|uniref:Uncharacterized protein n=1 Tax=Nyssa sinensis TaxID=561372 RepID=A0A5J5B5A2_9ASTE|nr:hypothetical protein F0562_029520 [Nyssa sinensis]
MGESRRISVHQSLGAGSEMAWRRCSASVCHHAVAPPRADVVKSLTNGIGLNLLGMGAAVLGMQATVGLLVAKALTSSANPYYQGTSPGYSPVLALDVFLVQASANTILSQSPGSCFLTGAITFSDITTFRKHSNPCRLHELCPTG